MLMLGYRQKWPMSFNPKRAFNIQVTGIAALAVSVAALAYLLYFVW
ncbi:hypothetical protein [Bradyrhizobium canariense]|nr:hypothetical protein [Bradyrhizobium canariense]MBR0951493.1 hypothetical protein [Bradyrhizobium canariense]